MRAIAFFLICVFMVANAYSQDRPAENEFARNFYLERSAKQNKTGLILLGTGTAFLVVGAAGFDSSWDSGSASQTDIFGFMILAGVVADLTSIPVLISAGVNKRRAMKITVSLNNLNEQYPQSIRGYMSSIAYRPGLTLIIRL
ncbi:MAG: hypothetical protein AB7U05_15305 [Mangrovibacterium sp.]